MKEVILRQLEYGIQCITNVYNNADIIDKIADAAKMISLSYNRGNKLLLFGNGGSAADAQHLAAEMINRFRLNRIALPAIALTTDSSVLTAIANDSEFSAIFERQLEALASPGDVALGISTSGNSINVYRGLQKAREIGVLAIGFLGNGGGNISDVCDLSITISEKDTPRIQEAHIIIGHIICDLVEKIIFDESSIKHEGDVIYR